MKLSFDNFWFKVVIFGIGAIVVWLMYSLIPIIGKDLPSPQVRIDNAVPCLLGSDKQIPVKSFEKGAAQYICGEMTTDTSPIRLTLLIYRSDNFMKSVYVTSAHLKQGSISFPIEPALPPGKYRALIMWARTAFADIYFDVKE